MEEKNLVELEQQLEEKDRKIQELEERIGVLEKSQKKRMKWWKKLLIVIGVIIALLVTMAVAISIMERQDKESPAMAQQIIQAIIDRDGESAYALFYPGSVEKEDFLAEFEQFSQWWHAHGGESTFSIKQKSWRLGYYIGEKDYTVTYEGTSGTVVFNLEISRVVRGNESGLVNIRIRFKVDQ